ncbi:pyridine nucleotide-disulfide oxidoreductase, partial [Parabacteroides sp. OttesenSCG-928-G07]|nr:pyridine nucleotide-disulfide oxidoreductase [Parabacteroides sp. OttesenSCG-928-G07]
MKKSLLLVVCLFAISIHQLSAVNLFVEAESFRNKGGWVVDQQFMDIMGSPYLMAHGMGEPVADAVTPITLPETGTYYIYVRTFNWTAPWKTGEGPGKFTLSVGGKRISTVLGATGGEWFWEPVGKITIRDKQTTLTLHDLTGFNGRCDAIYLTTEEGDVPPNNPADLAAFRKNALQLPSIPPTAGNYDLVVIGGGVAGLSAAVSA